MLSELSDKDILRYLRCKAEPQILSDIKRLKAAFLESATPRSVYARFRLSYTEKGILVLNTGLTLTGKDINNFLSCSDECYLAAATLGAEADRIIMYTERRSTADGLIIDAIASAAIEFYMDKIQRGLSVASLKRYSCGYGDLPITLQPDFLSTLNTQKTIGLTCNNQNIMIPRKSVTAIITERRGEIGAKKSCDSCKINCEGRKAGELCGH